MRDVRRWLTNHLGFVLLSILLALFSPIFTDVLPDKRIGVWAKVLLVAGNAALAIYTAISELRRNSTERHLRHISDEWEAKLREDRRAIGRRAALLQSACNQASEATAAVRASVEPLTNRTYAMNEECREARQLAVKSVLRALCATLDTDRAVDNDPLKATYFKATFFEFEPTAGGAGQLKRAYWHYPDTIQPRTKSWDIARDPNAAAVVAFVQRGEVVLSRVAEAASGGEKWKDSRPGQHVEYEHSSMVCIPIFFSQRDPSVENDVLGILTVDTNQLDYFRGGEDHTALRNEVFGPFIGLIRLAYAATALPEDTRRIHS